MKLTSSLPGWLLACVALSAFTGTAIAASQGKGLTNKAYIVQLADSPVAATPAVSRVIGPPSQTRARRLTRMPGLW